MIKCGVCGSENEAQALFCGTCGSPLSPADAKPVVEEAKPAPPATPDESVVPGKGGARRDLGTGGEATKPVITDVKAGTDTEPVGTETSGFPGPTVVCSVCATVNDATRTYCRKCANELKAAAGPPPPPPTSAPRKGLSPTIIGLGAAGVVVAIGLVVILALSGNGPVASASPTTATLPTGDPATTGPEDTPGATDGPQPTTEANPVTATELAGRIAFARCTGNDCVIVILDPSAGTAPEDLTSLDDGSAIDPAMTHDGQRVAYAVRDGLRIIDVGSREWTQHSTGRDDISPSWSTDDSNLTFAAQRERDPVPPTGDREIRLDGVSDPGPSEPLTANKTDDHDPVFTFDDQSIVWAQGEGDNLDLKLIDLGSRDITNLTDDGVPDADPAARPDRRQIAFASTRDSSDGFDLFLMDLDSQEITPLLSLPGDQHDPAWSPDGRFLVFSGPGDGGGRDLFVARRGRPEPAISPPDVDR